MPDTVVIGAGLSGLVAAIRLARAGRRVTLLAKGLGGLQLSQGTIDVLGYVPERVDAPLEGVASLPETHPYRVLGSAAISAGVDCATELLGEHLVGTVDRNVLLPTAVGSLRPTCLVPTTMTAGIVTGDMRYALVGFRQLKDFYPKLCAGNLERQTAPGGQPISARGIIIDLPAVEGMADSSALGYARAMDGSAYRVSLAATLKPLLQDGEVVGLPAILGYRDQTAHRHLEELLDHPVFEVPLPPPGVPGMRLNEALTTIAKRAGVRIIAGARVVNFEASGGRIVSVGQATAGRVRQYAADSFVYAPGGFESGALSMDSYGNVTETVFGLPLHGLGGDLVTADEPADQPLFRVGVGVDPSMRVVDPAGNAPYSNLYAAGGILAGAIRWSEKSGEGIALASAVTAADSILKGA
ncbi:MAG TPA: glycerol-3-phosphate dehydrogenase subunit GlpB [Propionibacteriaceae bacterium]|nr:glycerol-3-phosphate dehydrogenase subunit GlpB [Propionibacteriaceae bacterium]